MTHSARAMSNEPAAISALIDGWEQMKSRPDHDLRSGGQIKANI
jgi:hypothetical protein